MADANTVAVLGTGIMGAAMARNLLAAGMGVRVWNRTREKAEPLGEDGASVMDTPAEAADGADFLLTMLADAGATEEAVGDGVLERLVDGAVWVQTSTVGEEGNARLARKDAGLVLDAAEARNLGMTIASAVAARFGEAIDAGHSEEDMAAVFRAAAGRG